MSSAAISSLSIFEGDNPYAPPRIVSAETDSASQVGLFGARARYQIAGREIEVCWSHWTGWESYAVDGQLVAAFRNWSLRHKQSIELDARTGSAIEIESSVTPAFRVRIWYGGALVKEDLAPSKRFFDFTVGALLAVGVASLALVGCCFV
jgi:hypothetical protein